MVKIRLQRLGRKNQPFYRIIAIDSRAKRSGKALEILGHYNPLVNPAQIKIKRKRLNDWLGVGAQMTDTVKNLAARNS